MSIFKFKIKKITFSKIFATLSFVWMKSYKIIIGVYLLLTVFLGAYIWYENLYQGQWSQDKKQKFFDSQEKSVTLKEKDFTNILSEIEKRRGEYEKQPQEARDIFIPYAGYSAENKN
jgi:anionic cell wall polymer biosynthesis LytR-Cps2A-Psr (LCP) family protein